MKRLLLIVTFIFPSLTSAAAADRILVYRPEAATGSLPTTPEEGIAVETITIKKGDTLSKLARRYTGKGYYYPQFLLFNRVTNPNLIYEGDTLRTPLRPGSVMNVEPAASQPLPETRLIEPLKTDQSNANAPRLIKITARERKLFDKAMFQYRKKRYNSALSIFNRFLREYPGSPRASDAIFHRGECNLGLSRL